MRESDGVRSKFIEGNKKLGSPLEIIPVETKLEGGFPDVVCIRKSDGRVCVIEMKYVRPKEKRMQFRKNQPRFLRRWASLCPGVTKAWVFARIEIPGREGWYLFKVYPSLAWIDLIQEDIEILWEHSHRIWKLDSRTIWQELTETLFS